MKADREELAPHHRLRLLNSGISDEVASARGYRTVVTRAELRRLGFSESQSQVPVLLLPVWGVNGEIENYQIRPDAPRIKEGRPLKYELPFNSQLALDVHPSIRQHLGNPAVPLLVTEGIFKADAAISQGLCCIAVLGVWNWRGKNEHGGRAALADWESVALQGRDTYIAYDSDVMQKPQVHDALARLGAFLQSRGANLHYVYLPSGPGGTKVGLDDYLAAGHSVDDLLTLASEELRQPPAVNTSTDSLYVVVETGTVWNKPVERGTVGVHLANFSAVILRDIVEDDGAEERRQFEIETTLRGQRQRIQIPAQQFPAMSWVGEYLGAGAILEPGPGTRERLRHAIQTLSGQIPSQRVYAHTGWRLIDGVWVYLHGSGAIGPDGPKPGVAVGLRGPLGRIALSDPPEGEELSEVISAALHLLDLLPPEVVYPLLGATWLAPLRELLGSEAPDFVLWLHGPSGTFKSELLALAQGFYGDFTRTTLPVNFSATPNAVERFLFEAKDALLTVDDFHPAGDQREQQAMNQVANRLLRGAGNLAGRARMRADTTLRPALDPRALAIASGERLPEGHSTIARMVPIGVTPGAVDRVALTRAQAMREQYPSALAGYLKFLASDFGQWQAELPARFRELRSELQVSGSHRREPGQLAHMLLGLETFLSFAQEMGATNQDESDRHLRIAREILLSQAQEHRITQADEAPEALFLRYLADGFAGKRIYLEDRQGNPPENPEQWGWERSTSHGVFDVAEEQWRHGSTAQLAGVLDGEWLLLFPEQAYGYVLGAVRAAGRTFPVDQNTLIRRLDEAGHIDTERDGGGRRRKVNVWIGSSTKRVLKLRRDALHPPPSPADREYREDREGQDCRDSTEDQEDLVMPGTGVPDTNPCKSNTAPLVHPSRDPVDGPLLPVIPSLPVRQNGKGIATIDDGEVCEWRA